MSKTKWKNQFHTMDSASDFHNKVRKILAQDSMLKLFKCYQEVAVIDLIPDYESPRHHYDWYIEELNLVIELHGKQHYHMTNFGNISYDRAMQQFKSMQVRDQLKKRAAESAGINYLEIPYKLKSKLNSTLLKQLIFEAT